MKILKVSKNQKIQKTAMPARLGEIDGILHPMPAILSDEAKKEYPIFDIDLVKKLVANDSFLQFVQSEIGSSEKSLRQIFSLFVVEDDYYCKRYKNG